MSSSDDPKLPHDLVVEILKRLPVRSLLRFRCVSRSWRSAIDGPGFAAVHLSHSARHASNRHTVCIDWGGRLRKAFYLFSDEPLTLPSQSRIEIPFVTPPNGYDFVGSCDGLICVAENSGNGYGRRMYLWNLFTRKHKVVRGSGPEHPIFCRETAAVVLGFGVVISSNELDLKIVRILYCPANHPRCSNGTKPRVEIYSLSKDSWRSLECEVPALISQRPTAFLNGKLHWIASEFDGQGNESIVSFDVAGEMFDEMDLPEEILREEKRSLTVSVAVLNDLLAVFVNFVDFVVYPEPHSFCSVWVMMEYREPKSWTKQYYFEAPGQVVEFDGFTRNGKLLMEIDGGKRVSWDPNTGRFTDLPLSNTCDMVTIVESLISV